MSTTQPGSRPAFVIRLRGEFDIWERDRLRDAFAVAASAPLVIVDFEKVTYMDSTALSCLIELREATAMRSGELFLVNLAPFCRRIIEICGLDRVFDIRGSLSSVPGITSVPRAPELTLVSHHVATIGEPA
ncbi:MAG: STAS domain-containing protein [Candidatus Baltobacteraceae bacterium]